MNATRRGCEIGSADNAAPRFSSWVRAAPSEQAVTALTPCILGDRNHRPISGTANRVTSHDPAGRVIRSDPPIVRRTTVADEGRALAAFGFELGILKRIR